MVDENIGLIGSIAPTILEEAEEMYGDYNCNSSYFSNYNLCPGLYCAGVDYRCASGCCQGNYCSGYASSWCDDDNYSLVWLWWTLAALFLCLCIMSTMLRVQRRRRMMA